MTDLDDKLREILTDDEAHFYDVDKIILQAKQAVAASIIELQGTPEFAEGLLAAARVDGLMTGQEWLERFEKELDTLIEKTMDGTHYMSSKEDVLQAAHRASGIGASDD